MVCRGSTPRALESDRECMYILLLLLSSGVTLAKVPHFSEPQFLPFVNESNNRIIGKD